MRLLCVDDDLEIGREGPPEPVQAYIVSPVSLTCGPGQAAWWWASTHFRSPCYGI